jgi:hypothetical protein
VTVVLVQEDILFSHCGYEDLLSLRQHVEMREYFCTLHDGVFLHNFANNIDIYPPPNSVIYIPDLQVSKVGRLPCKICLECCD